MRAIAEGIESAGRLACSASSAAPERGGSCTRVGRVTREASISGLIRCRDAGRPCGCRASASVKTSFQPGLRPGGARRAPAAAARRPVRPPGCHRAPAAPGVAAAGWTRASCPCRPASRRVTPRPSFGSEWLRQGQFHDAASPATPCGSGGSGTVAFGFALSMHIRSARARRRLL